MSTSVWPNNYDNLVSAGAPAIEVQTHADAINAMQADVSTSGSARGGQVRAVNAVAISSGVAYKNTQPHDLHVSTPVATAGTVKIEVSPNGSTWTTLEAARTIAASGGPNIDSTLRSGWSLRLTATTSVLGTSIVH